MLGDFPKVTYMVNSKQDSNAELSDLKDPPLSTLLHSPFAFYGHSFLLCGCDWCLSKPRSLTGHKSANSMASTAIPR